jgi:hypothetical protein
VIRELKAKGVSWPLMSIAANWRFSAPANGSRTARATIAATQWEVTMFLRLDPHDNEIAHVYYSYDTKRFLHSHSARVDTLEKLFPAGARLRKWIEHDPHWWEEKPRDIGLGRMSDINERMPPDVVEALTW